jgi:glucose-1-phosphate cytidylyltransferase
MKVVVLAGGLGSRLAEETVARPKPMVEIGGHPILWHILRGYGTFGFREFVIACGFKSEVIKEYFHLYALRSNDCIVNLRDGTIRPIASCTPDWEVALVDTGLGTMTGGRLARVRHLLGNATFMATYGDGVGNVDIAALLAFHRRHGRLATVTAVRPPSRFGGLTLDGDHVSDFSEKPQTGEGWINGGFFVFEPEVLEYITDDTTVLERDPLERLTRDGELMAYRHDGFWQPMDTVRDRQLLESLWASGCAPWKTWR